MNYSVSEENYLKAVYHLQAADGTATTNEVADRLQTKAASVTDMMKKLSAKGLVDYTPYRGFSLSAQGKKTALFVIRRHRLWEFFLSQKLGFNWEEVHPLAEELEHVSSQKLIDRLDEYLGFPAHDPHGDPIPDNKGKLRAREGFPLADLPANQPVTVCRVANQSAAMLDLLSHLAIGIGTQLTVKKRFPFDGSVEVKLKAKTVTVSGPLAKNIFVAHEPA